MPRLQLIATAPMGLEAVVARELKELGYTDMEVENGRVTFTGDLIDICRAICGSGRRTVFSSRWVSLTPLPSMSSLKEQKLFHGKIGFRRMANFLWKDVPINRA